MASAHLRSPRPYGSGDFALWLRRFEAYARAVRVPQAQMSDALLSLLDDAAFRTYDLLGLSPEVTADYKLLTEALRKRFAPEKGEAELRFQLGQRVQQASETLDEFADAVLDLASRAYPELDAGVRMQLARDRFIAGVRADYIQEGLLQKAPKTLDDARQRAKQFEAARTARKKMQVTMPKTVHAVGDGTHATKDNESETPTGPEVAAVNRGDALLEAVRKNTEALQRVMEQMSGMQQMVNAPLPAGSRPAAQGVTRLRNPRRRIVNCWKCGAPGHVMRDCPSGGGGQPAARGQASAGSRHPGTFNHSVASQAAVYVTGVINGTEARILVDTGSAVTILSRELWEKGGNGSPTPLSTGSMVPVTAANGQPLEVLGTTTITLLLAGKQFTHEVLVADGISQSCLLGADFLVPHAAVINFGNQQLQVGGATESIQIVNGQRREVCRVAVSATTVLRGREEKLLWARIQHPDCNPNHAGVIEPKEGFESKHQVLVARVVAQPTNKLVATGESSKPSVPPGDLLPRTRDW